MQDKIIVRGAREHNLKNIDVVIPRDKLVVITGLSGSGKSSLAFDTIFAEGQRRYVESLSAYARQFIGQMEKPDVDQIEGLSPAVSIDQRGVSRNPRSTVGTVTEIYDYMRLMYARIGVPHCPECGEEIVAQSAQQIVEAVEALPDGARIHVMAPLIRDRKGHHERVFEEIQRLGFVRARVDGEVIEVSDPPTLDRYKNHTIEVVVDRLIIRHYEDPESEEAASARSRLTDSVETALELGEGIIIVEDLRAEQDHVFSEHLSCPHGHVSIPPLEPRMFSFNSPHGACPACQGLGYRQEFDPMLIVPNPELTLEDSLFAPGPWGNRDSDGWVWQTLQSVAEAYNVPMNVPWHELPQEQRDVIFYGTGERKVTVHYKNKRNDRRGTYHINFEGIIPNLQRRLRETSSEGMRDYLRGFMAERPCEVCEGRRLKPEALAVTVADTPIDYVTELPVSRALAWVEGLRGTDMIAPSLSGRDLEIANQVLKEIEARLSFLANVGLDYLTLSRSAASLSGGEAQRIRLATQIGSKLTGVLYVLDEPSIGLHQRDNERLIRTLEGMRDLGNTLLVVEHDEETMRCADWIVDLGPGAGEHGGTVVAEGPVEDIVTNPHSITGDYLSGRRSIAMPDARRNGTGEALIIRGARENNLKSIDVEIPLGKLVCVTGVSGSGKSTLVVETLYKRMAQIVNGSRPRPGLHDTIENVDLIDKVIDIDQSPIGRTPRSNPATYTKLFDPVRALYAELPESKVRGYEQGRFSFNVKGGRCENCKGQGVLKIEMQFLPDVYIACDVCDGSRYNRETLQIKYRGKTIADVLDMTVTEALDFFEAHPAITNKLETLNAVGLGYIRLGQPSPTLSGGEAQRIKLSRELSKRPTGMTLYVLDEPSVGLHAADVAKLIHVLQALVDQGNTVVIIEHHPDIIKVADHLIDLGPEGGEAGGEIIVTGTPEAVASCPESYTGRFLREMFGLGMEAPEPIEEEMAAVAEPA